MTRIIKFKPKVKEIPPINIIDNKIIINNINENELHIYGPPGLGDLLWCINKIYDNTEKDIYIHSFSRHVYSAYLLNNLPKVKSVTQFNTYRNYRLFTEKCKQEYNKYNQLNDLNNINEMYIEMNNHVDNGNPIHTFLPKLKTNYNLPWVETQKDRVESLYNKNEYILIYTSSISNNNIGVQHTGGWTFNNWNEIINKFKDKYKIVWIGSSHDHDALKEIIKTNNIDYYLNEPLDFLIPLMKNCKAFIGYQSGLNCITIQGLCPTYMLYFNKLTKLPYMICSPEMINNKKYKPEHFNNYNINTLNQWVEEL
jgi:ADP-heptose:LPS heptosyltransferase